MCMREPTAKSVTIDQPQYNITINGDAGAVLDGTTVPGLDGIDMITSGNSVKGMTIRNYQFGVAIFAPGSVNQNTVTGCTIAILASVYGDGVNLPAPTSIDQNMVSSNFDGIYLSGENVTVSQNVVMGNGLAEDGIGIFVSFSDHCTVSQNIASMNGEGIHADSGTTACLFRQNVALGNQVVDAEDDSGGQNTWTQNVFGTTIGI